jgi:hypothetical protein
VGIAIAAVLLVTPAFAEAAVDDTILVSRANGLDGVGADSFSVDSGINADGCRISFQGTADNLGTVQTNTQNVFWRDACAGLTEVVAIDSVTGLPADELNASSTIDDSGCKVAFWTTDSLVPADPDVAETIGGFPADEGSVYVRDVCTDTTTLVSLDQNGNSVSVTQLLTSISADGDRVAFSTGVPVDTANLDPGDDTNNARDVFIRDVSAGTTTLASVNAAGTAASNGDSRIQTEGRQALSDDGRYLSMITTASDMATSGPGHPDTNAVDDIYVRDLDAGVAQRANLSDADQQLSQPPGTLTTFFSWAISGDGRRIAWTSNSPELGGNGFAQVWLRDLDAGTTELISRASGPEGDIAIFPGASRPALDETGRHVAFASNATNLATNVNGAQIYVRDVLNQTTHAASRKSGVLGELSTGASVTEDPSFSDNGRFLSFVSTSPDLAPGDANGPDQDVFRRELAEPGLPKAGVNFNVRPTDGTARYRTPGSDSYAPLEHIEQLPEGSVIDARSGRVAVTTERTPPASGAAAAAGGPTAVTSAEADKPVQTAEFFQGRFGVVQKSAKLATMKLAGKAACGRKGGKKKGGKKNAFASGGPLAHVSGRGRSLWGSGRGRYATRGNRGAGAVRGTIWFVQDKCNGDTLMRVTQGTLEIDDFAKKGKANKVIKAPGKYVAKAKKKGKK